MSSDNFVELSPTEQVIFINKLLETKSLTQISIDFNIPKNILKSEFIQLGYIYDSSKKQFLLEESSPVTSSFNRSDTSYSSNNIQAISTNHALNNTNKKYEDKLRNNSSISYKIIDLEKKIDEIKQIINDNLAIINSQDTIENENKSNIIPDDISIKTYDSATLVPRTYKVNSTIQQQFKEFCKQNNNYRVSDLVTNAFVEYMNKFR